MKKQNGYAGGLLLLILAAIAVGASIYKSQDNQDVDNVVKAVDVAGKEEAASLDKLDKATHQWLNSEFNRERLHDYDTRYEIPIDELISDKFLPSGFAQRFNNTGESVYGLLYTTSVIRKTGPSANDTSDDEYNVLTTIGERGTFPPNEPPTKCPVYYSRIHDGIYVNGINNVLVEPSNGSLPLDGSCNLFNAGTIESTLISNWAFAGISGGTPQATDTICTRVGTPVAPPLEDIYPFPTDSYYRCVYSTNSAVADCPVRFTWTVDGTPMPLSNPFNFSLVKVYSSASCSAVRVLASADVRNNNGLLRSTAAVPFEPGTPSCVVSGSGASQYIRCTFAQTTGGGGGDCPLYFTWTVDGTPNPVGNPFNQTHLKTYPSTSCGTVLPIASADVRNDNGLIRSTAGVPFEPSTPACSVVNSSGSERIECAFAQTSGGPGNLQCDVYKWDFATSSMVYQTTHNGTDCYGNVP